jgi:ABC-type multidrug transport system ATPase subunit
LRKSDEHGPFCTTNVSSHRLSTITAADQILVLHAGRVVEAGTHQELLALNGRYHNMWRKQIRAEQAAEQASRAVAKANALRELALARPGSSGNEGGMSGDVSESETDAPSNTRLADSSAVIGSVSQTTDVHQPSGSIAGSNHETLVDDEAPEDGGQNDNLGQHIAAEAQPFNARHYLGHEISSDENIPATSRRHHERSSPH